MSDATADPPPAEPKAAAANVIRLVRGAEETSQERLLKKQVPAWVVSGAFHVVILVALIVIGKMQPAPAQASEAITEAVVDKEDQDEKPVDLTNDDKGLDSELANTLPVDRQDEQTVDAKINLDQPVGNELTDTTPMDVQSLIGQGTGADLGVLGTDGNVMAATRARAGPGRPGSPAGPGRRRRRV